MRRTLPPAPTTTLRGATPARRFDLDLTRPSQNGVHFVGRSDLDRLAQRARHDELQVAHTDLMGCIDKNDLMQRLTLSLSLPTRFEPTWDALADGLRDLHWMPAWGHVLLFDHVDDLRRAAPADFTILLGVLDDAATFAVDQDRPWFAFLSLPEEPVEDAGTAGC